MNKNSLDKNAYMKEWRRKNRLRIKAINRKYYLRNKGWLNKSRTRPWGDEQVIQKIISGDREYISIMLRILRPEKDPFVEG